MPYPNEHAARLRDPDDFRNIAQLWKNDEGIRALGGKLKSDPDGGTVEQTIRFLSSKWTVAAAKKWLKEHDYEYILFEPAEEQDESKGEILQTIYGTTWAIVPERLKAMLVTAELRGGLENMPDIVPQIAITGSRNSIGIIPLYGTITQRSDILSLFYGGTSTDGFTYIFNGMLNDNSIDAVIIDIDSPGGTVSGVPELSQTIHAARSTKPIYAIANSFAGSAAYWIGSAADKFYVTPSGEVGSIGVFVLHEDWSEAMKQMGVKPTFIHGGKYKVEANPFEPLEEEAREYIQQEVDVYYNMFVADIARNRDVPKSTVLKEYGQGRMVNARDAVRRGMADKIGTLTELITGLDTKFTKQRNSIKKQRNALEFIKARD